VTPLERVPIHILLVLASLSLCLLEEYRGEELADGVTDPYALLLAFVFELLSGRRRPPDHQQAVKFASVR
jgi:hypothetical protein